MTFGFEFNHHILHHKLLFLLSLLLLLFSLKATMRKTVWITPLRGKPKPFLLYAKLTSLADAMLRLLEDHKTD